MVSTHTGAFGERVCRYLAHERIENLGKVLRKRERLEKQMGEKQPPNDVTCILEYGRLLFVNELRPLLLAQRNQRIPGFALRRFLVD